MHKLPHLYRSRHGVWYLRYRFEGQQIRRSLQTRDWHTARLLGLQFNLTWAMTFRKFDVVLPGGIAINNINSDEDLHRVKQLLGQEELQALIRNLTPQPPVTGGAATRKRKVEPSATATDARAIGNRSKLFSEVVDLYLIEKKFDNTEKTILEKRSNYSEFVKFFGDSDINIYSGEIALSYKNRLIGSGQSALRINKRLSFLKDLFGYAIDNKLFFEANPFQNAAISTKSKLRAKVQSYQEFTDEELKLIFDEGKYRAFMKKPDYYWLPFLALHSGARIEELASLKVHQIKQEGGIWFFDLEKGKNSNSIRRIPIHQNVLNSGFTDYIESAKGAINGQLFPHLKDGKNGFSKNCSRRFGEYLDHLGVKNERKVFHSFRSSFINRMTETAIHPAILMGIVGHYEQSKIDFSSPHFQTYQQQKPLKILKEAIDKLTFELEFFF